MKNLGELIREARRSRNFSQWDVAKALSVARTTVSNWECGRAEPDLRTLRLLSEVLQRDLLSEQTESNPIQEQTGRKMRLKLRDSPVIEVIAPENTCDFSDFAIDLHVNAIDSHENPVNIHVSANFCVENDDE